MSKYLGKLAKYVGSDKFKLVDSLELDITELNSLGYLITLNELCIDLTKDRSKSIDTIFKAFIDECLDFDKENKNNNFSVRVFGYNKNEVKFRIKVSLRDFIKQEIWN